MHITVFILIGFISGFTSGAFGIGAAAIAVPLLYIVGLPLLSAFGVNLLAIPLASLVASIGHRKNIDFKIAWKVVLGGIIGTTIGVFFVGSVSTKILATIFLAVSGIAVFGVYFCRLYPEVIERIKPNKKIIVIGSLFLNLLAIMRGGSGASLFPPFLRMMRLSVRKAIATSIFANIFTAITGSIIFLAQGNIEVVPALSVTIGAVIGANLGSVFSLKAEPSWLELGFSTLVMLFALIVFAKAFM